MRNPIPLLLLLLFYMPVYAGNALVDGAWLKENLADQSLYVLDIQSPERYLQYHVPGAINAPFKVWRTDKQSTRPGMLPPFTQLDELASGLGIKKAHHIIIVTTGSRPSDMSAASRVFWTLKIMGHEEVSLLNGGLASYANQFGGAIENKPNLGIPTQYMSTPDTSLAANIDAVQSAIKKGTPLLDARTLGEYMGVVTARPDERAGTLPGALHLPFDWLVDSSGNIRDKPAITTLFQASGFDVHRDGIIHFCHTGNRAALSWFVDYAILGHKNAKLYDASMSEWSLRKELPIETRIHLTIGSPKNETVR